MWRSLFPACLQGNGDVDNKFALLDFVSVLGFCEWLVIPDGAEEVLQIALCAPSKYCYNKLADPDVNSMKS